MLRSNESQNQWFQHVIHKGFIRIKIKMKCLLKIHSFVFPQTTHDRQW